MLSFVLESSKKTNINFKKLSILGIIVALACLILPNYLSLSPQGTRMLILFFATMAGIILDICHPIVWVFVIISTAALTQTIKIVDGFSGFANSVPWLLFCVLSISKTITNSSLGMRIAYFFMKHFGSSIIGLSYSIMFTEFLLAPILPSNTARSASLGLPLTTSLSKYISSNIKISEQQIGAYLSLLYSWANALTSGLFFTAMISNVLVAEGAAKFGVTLTWISWFKYIVAPYLIVMLLVPFILKFACSPKISNLKQLRKSAAEKCKEMGQMPIQEKFILLVFLGMLVFWVGAEFFNISVMTTTLVGICLFIFTGILNIKDILSNYGTFNSMMLLGFLISLVNCLISLGVIDWFNQLVSGCMGLLNKGTAFLMITSIYYFAQYMFTGESAKIIALYVPFLSTGVALGLDILPLAVTLAAFSSASDVLASYTCPTALTMSSTGYVSLAKWVKAGLIFTAVFLSIWYLYIWICF